jgi:hypothetical protein
MKKIGVLYGMENSFPFDLVDKINSFTNKNIIAEFMQIGAVKMEDIIDYDVILDRVSHEVPFYRSILKLAVLNNVRVINNPFWNSADDNFFHSGLASRMGIPTPRTVILPTKEHPLGTNSDTMRNMEFPIKWDEVFDYVGFPANIKPCRMDPAINSYKVYNPQDFFTAYDLTGKNVMILQEAIEYERYYRCFVIGKSEVRIMHYDPMKPQHMRYSKEPIDLSAKLTKKISQISTDICTALGFDYNAIEFAVKDDEVYAVDLLNPTPTSEAAYLQEDDYNWLVDTTAELLVKYTRERKSRTAEYNWNRFLTGTKAPAAKAPAKIVTKSKKTKTIK